MKILILSQWFQPEPFFKGLPLAKALRNRGHDVEVLTGFPNYPGGKVYPGYRIRPWQREEMEGIRVNRAALYPSHDRSGVRRILNYLSFGASAALLGPWLVRRPDVIYVYNLVTLGLAAGLIRGRRRCPVVLDVQDLWPESVAGSGMMKQRVLQRILAAWCRRAYRRADRLIVLSPGFKRNLVERGIPAERIDVVYNWYDEDYGPRPEPDANLTEQLGFSGRFNIVFAGTMGVMQALGSVIAAAKMLFDRQPDILFTFVGDGVEVGRLKEASAGLGNVQFIDRRPKAEVNRVLASADALLVHLKDDPLFEITIPSKIQTYLYCGKPILCGVRGDAAELVCRAEAGIPFAPENSHALADAVLKLRGLGSQELLAMGNRGHDFYCRALSQEQGVKRFEEIFKQATWH